MNAMLHNTASRSDPAVFMMVAYKSVTISPKLTKGEPSLRNFLSSVILLPVVLSFTQWSLFFGLLTHYQESYTRKV